jgi:predicted O-methyltransferase YrrM
MDISFSYSALLAVILISLVVLMTFVLHKIRKVHLAIYILLNDAAVTRRETESLFAQIQALLALERKLGLIEALPPMRGWAGSPDFLLIVADEILARKPQTVMECSSGVSTLVVARCLQMNGAGHVYSLEHNPDYAGKTRKLLDKYDLVEWATVLDAPLQTKHTGAPWYDEEVIPKDLAPIEILIVDGPPSQTAPLARFPALPRLLPRMAKDAIVIVDDADREDEQEIVKRWKQLFPELRQTGVNCEKGCVLIELDTTRNLQLN